VSNIQSYDASTAPQDGFERTAVLSQAHGFHIRHPPKPHLLCCAIAQDKILFQTVYMGAVDVDLEKWQLVIDGLVKRPFALTFEQLR
jgi:DMSO/TMAO reductase YedYZ molybdopterin-dependent catalytic subunit